MENRYHLNFLPGPCNDRGWPWAEPSFTWLFLTCGRERLVKVHGEGFSLCSQITLFENIGRGLFWLNCPKKRRVCREHLSEKERGFLSKEPPKIKQGTLYSSLLFVTQAHYHSLATFLEEGRRILKEKVCNVGILVREALGSWYEVGCHTCWFI